MLKIYNTTAKCSRILKWLIILLFLFCVVLVFFVARFSVCAAVEIEINITHPFHPI